MAIIKRIILWIINLIKKIFGIRDNVTSNKKSISFSDSQLKKKKNVNQGLINESLPPYMMINDADKATLISNIQSVKKKLLQNSIKENEIKKIISILQNDKGVQNQELSKKITIIQEYLNNHELNKLNTKKLDGLLEEFDIETKKEVFETFEKSKNNYEFINNSINKFEEITNYVKNHDISIDCKDYLTNKLENFKVEIDKDSFVSYDIDIVNKIRNWDNNIVQKVKQEYAKLNYVTLSTFMIDEIVLEYQKIEDNYNHHRYNKYYYEKEICRIKDKIKYLQKIRNTGTIQKEIEGLRKELYTKSKDKYDILYNNEIFIDIEKRCDKLLNKVNQKIVDIKKDEKKELIDKKNKKKMEYIENIIKRFQDLNLSREIILLYQEKQDKELSFKDISLYLDKAYLEFVNGINDKFNYQRNKTKTELVKLYNDLNKVLSVTKKESIIPIEHINFRMDDIIEAVEVKKEVLDNIYALSNSQLVDDKIANIKNVFLEKYDQKKLVKDNFNSYKN